MHRCASLYVLGLSLVVVTTASAADPGREKHRFNTADQAAARAVTVKRTNLRPANGWRGGVVKPDFSGVPPCPNYHPDQSYLVLTGAAATHWVRSFQEIDNQTEVLQNTQMVRREWQLEIETPHAVPCIRRFYEKTFAAGGAQLISFMRIPFPQIATHAAGYEGVLEFGHRRLVFEIAQLAMGRAKVEVSVAGPSQRNVAAETRRLAHALVARVRA
jgi:hypothetical protein